VKFGTISLALLASMLMACTEQANESAVADANARPAMIMDDAAAIANVKTVFKEMVSGREPDLVSPSPIDGMYEAVFGAQVMYISADGRFLVQGDVYDLTSKRNLTETTRTTARKTLISTLDPAEMITFTPKVAMKHQITVFTDIDCGYCRKLHGQMDEYLAEGIEVRYLAFPRAGMNSKSYDKAVSVWCSDNRQQAMTEAKAGKALAQKTCDNPVAKHLALAEQFGVTGTPTIVMSSGEVVPGYVPPKRLIEMLDQGA